MSTEFLHCSTLPKSFLSPPKPLSHSPGKFRTPDSPNLSEMLKDIPKSSSPRVGCVRSIQWAEWLAWKKRNQ